MAKNRYIGEYPAIGIRPIVDGRRGPMRLRESLEDQVMAMANAAKKLFEENLYYSNGEHVRVVMADSSIGRVPETAACADKFRREGVAITLSVTPCWCYGAETMDMDPTTIKGIWGFNGTERPGAVYLASVLATHAQKGLLAFGIYGHEVQDRDQVTEIPEDVKEKLLRFGRAAVAVATMRGKSYLQIGSMCMGIGGSIIDQDFMESYLGMRVESVDEVEILRRMEEGIYNEEQYQKALAWTKEHCREGRDDNPDFVKFSDSQKEKQWEFTVKMYCIIKDLMAGNPDLPTGFEEEMVGHNAIAGGFQGQRQWTDHWPNCDYPEALLSSTFDYEGAREPYTLATENDVLNGLGMIRLNLVKGLGPVLQIAEGWTVDLPENVSDILMERTNPTWPCTWFAPRCDGREGSPFKTAYEVMQNWGANHGAISYGHIGADLITMCSMLRIPVCMHNVPEEKIFRPAAWNAFGMDKEGADYRACAAYGPLYK